MRAFSRGRFRILAGACLLALGLGQASPLAALPVLLENGTLEEILVRTRDQPPFEVAIAAGANRELPPNLRAQGDPGRVFEVRWASGPGQGPQMCELLLTVRGGPERAEGALAARPTFSPGAGSDYVVAILDAGMALAEGRVYRFGGITPFFAPSRAQDGPGLPEQEPEALPFPAALDGDGPEPTPAFPHLPAGEALPASPGGEAPMPASPVPLAPLPFPAFLPSPGGSGSGLAAVPGAGRGRSGPASRSRSSTPRRAKAGARCRHPECAGQRPHADLPTLATHVADRHAGESGICPQCGFRPKLANGLARHALSHDTVGRYPCGMPGCPQTYKYPEARCRHIKATHGGHPCTAPGCLVVCGSREELESHDATLHPLHPVDDDDGPARYEPEGGFHSSPAPGPFHPGLSLGAGAAPPAASAVPGQGHPRPASAPASYPAGLPRALPVPVWPSPSRSSTPSQLASPLPALPGMAMAGPGPGTPGGRKRLAQDSAAPSGTWAGPGERSPAASHGGMESPAKRRREDLRRDAEPDAAPFAGLAQGPGAGAGLPPPPVLPAPQAGILPGLPGGLSAQVLEAMSIAMKLQGDPVLRGLVQHMLAAAPSPVAPAGAAETEAGAR